MRFETKLIHSGDDRVKGAIAMPVFQSTMYELAGEQGYDNIRYIRLNNTPNHLQLHQILASLENGETSLVTASGMAAISTSLLSMLSAGDHLLAQKGLYGGTHSFITEDMPRFGITFDFIDGEDTDSWKRKLRPNTKAIYVESITNPLLRVADLKSVVRFARENELLSMIDNTFASPVNFRAAEFGFDLSIHSCTKYLNGHSDIVAGCVIGKKERIRKITHTLNHLGGALDPHACFLLYRGIKTLSVRMNYINQSTLQIAKFLENHPEVEKVNYPGLSSHPGHQRATELFYGFGGVLSFELKGGLTASESLIKRLKLPIHTVSVGGPETLITRPTVTSHAALTEQDQKSLGLSDGLLRLSIGLESTEDLIEDFSQALQ
jgi:cystathionine beta-lyase/cystathionine gamma-synthase